MTATDAPLPVLLRGEPEGPRAVHSNQQDMHPDLRLCVEKYLRTLWRRPVSGHTHKAFLAAREWVALQQRPVVLDSGCGTGESTLHLAQRFPDCVVLGLDKSAVRLSRAASRDQVERVLFLRVDLQDFWPLAATAGWNIVFHALYYPNPWPKSIHLKRRFHAHPVFPVLLGLAPELELRTNWLIYAREFAQAALWAGADLAAVEPLSVLSPVSAFERKYSGVSQRLWQVRVAMSGKECEPDHRGA